MRRHAWNCDLSTKPGTDILTNRHIYIYIYETNQNLGGYNGLYSQRYDLGSSQPWGTQIFWPPVTGDLHQYLKRSGGCYTFTMKHSTIQDPLPNSQKHPRATCSRCPNCRKLTYSPPRNAMIPRISKLFFRFFAATLGSRHQIR